MRCYFFFLLEVSLEGLTRSGLLFSRFHFRNGSVEDLEPRVHSLSHSHVKVRFGCFDVVQEVSSEASQHGHDLFHDSLVGHVTSFEGEGDVTSNVARFVCGDGAQLSGGFSGEGGGRSAGDTSLGVGERLKEDSGEGTVGIIDHVNTDDDDNSIGGGADVNPFVLTVVDSAGRDAAAVASLQGGQSSMDGAAKDVSLQVSKSEEHTFISVDIVQVSLHAKAKASFGCNLHARIHSIDQVFGAILTEGIDISDVNGDGSRCQIFTYRNLQRSI